jgi:hypothetical protein
LDFSLSTLHREYAALVALPYYDLYEKILQPQLSPIPNINPNDVDQTMTKYNVNKPQAIAILGSLQVDGFALIQGYVKVVLRGLLLSTIKQTSRDGKDFHNLWACPDVSVQTSTACDYFTRRPERRTDGSRACQKDSALCAQQCRN